MNTYQVFFVLEDSSHVSCEEVATSTKRAIQLAISYIDTDLSIISITTIKLT